MTASVSIPSLDAAALMAHMQVLCKRIGPRPPASPQEHAAGEYVKQVLGALGLPALAEQPFMSHNSLGWVMIPPTLAAAASLPLALIDGWGKLAAALLYWLGLVGMIQALSGAPVFYRRLIERWRSRNLWLDLPPAGEAKRRLFLVGHLDTQKQRFTAPLPWPQIQGATLVITLGGGAAVGLWLLLGGVFGWSGIPWTIWAYEFVLIGFLLQQIIDECQPHIEGANDNATAVSILLGMAAALRERPLQNTAVTLLFTGCEEVPCVGMEAFLREQHVSVENSYWIDLEMVGAGSLCYVTQHGMSPIGRYFPHPEMLQLAAQVARKQPALGLTGKPMLILEEVANLRRRGYKAVCLAGYNAQGFLPNWHRLSDCLENIEPPTLERAALFTWALAQEVDCLG